MADKGRKIADDRLLIELAAGRTIADAAKRAGVADRTVYRRLRDPAFVDRLKETRASISETSLNMLIAASTKAVETLVALLVSGTDSVRLASARSILDAGMRLKDSLDLQERLRRIEISLEDGHGASSANRSA